MLECASVELSQPETLNRKDQRAGSRNVKPCDANELKPKSSKAQQKMSPPKIAKTPLCTADYDDVSEQRDGEDRVPPREADDDGITYDKKGEDQNSVRMSAN